VNIDATQQELAAATDVLKLAGFLDDRAPHPDKGRIAAWAEQIHRHRLTRPDLMSAVQLYYDSHSNFPIQIGDVIELARGIRRDRGQRDDERPQLPPPGQASSPEHREKCMAEIRAVLAKQGAKWSIPKDL
jgi:hypothetical protein